jgi:hypothetical protein
MDGWLLFLRILLAGALYLFLGAILWLLWRDLHRPASDAILTPRNYGRLTVIATATDVEGADDSLAVGDNFALQAINSLGRSVINTIIIPDAYASAEHALLIYRGGQWWLEDRGSRNGTTVNNIPIDAPTVISAGEIIGIGRVQLKLELVDG